MTNKDLIRQYMGTCDWIPASQLAKVSDNMKRTHFKLHLGMVQHITNYSLFEKISSYAEAEGESYTSTMEIYNAEDEYYYVKDDILKIMPMDVIPDYVKVMHPKVLAYLMDVNYSNNTTYKLYKGIMQVGGVDRVMQQMKLSDNNPMVLLALAPEEYEAVMEEYAKTSRPEHVDFYKRRYAERNGLPLTNKEQVQLFVEKMRRAIGPDTKTELWVGLDKDAFEQGILTIAKETSELDHVPIKYYPSLIRAKGKVDMGSYMVSKHLNGNNNMERLKGFIDIMIETQPQKISLFRVSSKEKIDLVVELLLQRLRKGIKPQIDISLLGLQGKDEYKELLDYYDQ